MTESFWTIPEGETLRTPMSILREQASALTRQTHGLLVGEVRAVSTASPTDEGLDIEFSVLVPSLNNFRYRLLVYRQPVTLYPGVLWVRVSGDWPDIPNEEALIDVLRKVLASSDVVKVVRALLAQAREVDDSVHA